MGSWGARFWTQNCDETLHGTCTSAMIPDMEGLRVSGWILVKSLTKKLQSVSETMHFFKWETHGTNPWSLSKSTDYSEIHWFWFRQSPRRIFFPRFWKHRLFGPGALYDGTGARESLGGPGGPGAPQFPCELRLCQLPVLRTAWHKLVVLWLSILRRWKLPRQRVGVSARR